MHGNGQELPVLAGSRDVERAFEHLLEELFLLLNSKEFEIDSVARGNENINALTIDFDVADF